MLSPMATPPTTPNLSKPSEPAALSEQEKQVIPTPDQMWSDSRAHAIALADFSKAETYRARSHDRRYKVSEELWLAWRQPKVWEGTRIPRASMGVFLALEQIMALVPRVTAALFGDDRFFEVRPWQDATLSQAQAVYQLLRYQLADLGPRGLISFREVMNRCFHQMFQYGNMIAEFKWDMRQQQKLRYDRVKVPVKVMVPHPIYGQVPMTNGDYREQVQQTLINEIINKPIIQQTDIRDFYSDPNCPSSNIQEGGYAATRHLVPVQWILDNCKAEAGFVPFTQSQLIELAKSKRSSEGDNSKAHTETVRNNSWNPTVDQSSDPALQQVELIRYFQRDRQVWMFNRELAMNQPSEFGCIPFVTMGNVPVQGRWHALSICDLVEGDQRLMEAILNARLDELNLAIHPPIIKPLGMKVANSQRRLRPGVEWEVEDMKQVPQKMEFGEVTQQSYIEVEAADRRVQKVTGNSDLVALGSPSAGGNSANRTAAGINVQAQATNTRTEYLVENIEDQFFVPLLNAVLAMNQKYLDPQQMLQIVGQDGNSLQIDPLEVLNASVKFEMRGASKMRSQARLQQMLPWYVQTVFNPELLQLWGAQMGITPNMEAFSDLLAEAGGFKPKQLFTQLSPQQQQAMKSPSPDKLLDQQMQQERLQTMQDMGNQDSEAKLALGIIKELLKDPAVREKLTGITHSEKKKLEMPPAKPAAR
jgi:hypothetical protein